MSLPPSPSTARGRFRRICGSAVAVAVSLTGLAVVGATSAHAADVAPSVRPIIKNQGSPTGGELVAAGKWGIGTYLGYTVDGKLNSTKDDFELKTLMCGPEADGMGSAFVPASEDPVTRGSAERPHIAAGTPPWETFKYLFTDTPGAVYGGITNNDLASREYVEAALGGDPSPEPVPFFRAFPADTLVSLVIYCTKGKDPVADVFAQPMVDAEGYAISTWMTFRTVASTEDPAQTSAGFKIVGDTVTPAITLGDHWVDGAGTLTAALKGEDGTALTDATGKVHFFRGAGAARTEVGSADVSAAGTASLSLAGLVSAGGTAQFDASYVPDAAASARYSESISGRYTVVAPAATTTTLAVTGDLVEGTSQTLTATVAPAGTGTVTFHDGATNLGSAPVASGKASITKALSVGPHTLTARFEAAENAAFLDSESSAQTVTIAIKPPAKASASLAASAASAVYGQPVRVSVTAAGGATGPVTLSEGGKTLGTGTLGGGSTSITLAGTVLAPGAHQLTVSYPGDAAHVAANAATTVQIAKGATTTSAKLVTKKIVRKKTAAKITVQVTANGFTPAGKVTVYQGKKKLGTATIKAGKATVKLKKFTKAGTAKLTVTYAGNATANASSKALKVKVRSR